jgi:tetratricopeptide (TPR) repeat protein
MRCTAIALLVSAALALPAAAHAADRPWVEVKSPHFVVVSHDGEGAGRDTAFQFEQVRSVFTVLWPWAKMQSGRRFVVVVGRDEKDLRALAPQYWEGRGFRPVALYAVGVDGDYVALRTDADRRDELSLNPYANAYEGFAAMALSSAFPPHTPLWFEQGLKEFIGNTLVREKDVHVGRVISYHLETLSQGTLLPLGRLLHATPETLDLRDLSTRRQFDAESWALVHYLVFGEKQANLPRFNRFAALLLAGRPAEDAMREAFGGDLTALEAGLRAYIAQRLFAYSQVKLDVDVSRQSFTARPLSAGEAAVVRAGFLAANDRPVEARAALAEARVSGDKLAGLHEVEGLLLDAEHKEDEAAAAFARAIALGSENYYTHYRHAGILWPKEGGDFAPIVRDLEAATRLNPDFAKGHAWLAHARVETRALPAAVESASKAVALAPAESENHLALARALGHAGRYAEAMQSAERAIALARDDREREEATKLQAWIRPRLTNR